MIIEKTWVIWHKINGIKIKPKYVYNGYFLFGIIPLYIKRVNVL